MFGKVRTHWPVPPGTVLPVLVLPNQLADGRGYRRLARS
jgi:hypothetical protein